MNSNDSEGFLVFALERKHKQEPDLRRWAKQSDNPVLRELAQEVLDISGEAKKKIKK